MLYIIGVDHRIQCKSDICSKKDYDDFIKYSKDAIVEFNIDIVAEEYNEDCLEKYNMSESILQSLAKEMGLTHIFLEPSIKQKIKLGINDFMEKNHKLLTFEIREKYWISKLQNNLNDNIFCVIGSSHKESFTKLLNEKDINYSFEN